ncbi:MAG TPA: beta-N-acetylhexosaminidase [Gemmatimonadaceae bacterium]|nr:beta-N-acetylhexosaminidase [Gemmatimonadaceae bacterium]
MRISPLYAFLLVSVAAPLTAQNDLRLIPQPREVTVAGAAISVAKGITIGRPSTAEDRFAATDLAAMLNDRGIRVVNGESGPGIHVVLMRADGAGARSLLRRHSLVIDSAMHDEGYAIIPDGNRLVVIGATGAGVFYGAQTVKQLVSGDGDHARLYRATIRDWPAMRYRGFHDDISRGPVPTLDFQKKQIRTLAAYKVNTFSPYYEHTLEYESNPLIAPPGGAMTHADVKELVAYASQYHVDIIPEQEAFGHLHHLLKYEIYSPLGETPHGHVLAPGQPGSVPLIRQMFAEIFSLFPSHFVHLGADETFELGRGQTADRVKTVGIGVVYLDFLRQIVDALRPSGKKFLFWGDVALSSPELVNTIPKDLIAVPWSYGADTSYVRLIKPFRDVGMETWVAPGVSSWNRVYPNNANALVNIQRFVRDGQRLGATGMINTSWDDDGEALFNQTWYGDLFGAAAAWQSGESSIDAFASSYGRVFHGDMSGKVDEAQRKLSAAHALLSNAKVGDASNYLFWLDPWSDEGRSMSQRIRPYTHDLRILAESTLVLLDQASPSITRERDAIEAMKLGARRMDFIGMKFQFADEVVAMYDRARDTTSKAPQRDLADITGVNGRLQDLRDGLSLIRDEYEKAWLRENRPYWLHNVLARYDLATQLWIERGDRVNLARQEWYRSHRLPPAESIGIPASMPGLAPYPR